MTVLKDVCDLVSGRHIATKDYNSDSVGMPYLTGPSDFGDLYPVITKWTEFPQSKAKSGDILVTVKGSGVGKINQLDLSEVAISRQLMAVRPTGVNTQFLYYLLKSKYDYFQEKANGAAIPGLSRPDILGLQVPDTSLAEQKRIVAILDEAFGAIDRAKRIAEKNLSNAIELFDSYLNRVFTEKGEGWEETTIVDVCQSLHQGLNTAGQKIKFHESGFPIIQTRNVNDGVIDLDEKIKFMCEDDWDLYREKYRPEVGDVFFTNIGTIGKTAVVTESMDYLIHWNIFKLRPINDKIASDFLKCTLDYLTQSGFFKRMQKGGTVEFVTKKMISGAVFHLPPVARQHELVAEIKAVSLTVKNLRTNRLKVVSSLDELKQSILQKAFTGQLTAKSPELEAVP